MPSRSAVSSAVVAASTPLPEFWYESVDPQSGTTYYYHTLTKERTNQRPTSSWDTTTTTTTKADKSTSRRQARQLSKYQHPHPHRHRHQHQHPLHDNTTKMNTKPHKTKTKRDRHGKSASSRSRSRSSRRSGRSRSKSHHHHKKKRRPRSRDDALASSSSSSNSNSNSDSDDNDNSNNDPNMMDLFGPVSHGGSGNTQTTTTSNLSSQSSGGGGGSGSTPTTIGRPTGHNPIRKMHSADQRNSVLASMGDEYKARELEQQQHQMLALQERANALEARRHALEDQRREQLQSKLMLEEQQQQQQTQKREHERQNRQLEQQIAQHVAQRQAEEEEEERVTKRNRLQQDVVADAKRQAQHDLANAKRKADAEEVKRIAVAETTAALEAKHQAQAEQAAALDAKRIAQAEHAAALEATRIAEVELAAATTARRMAEAEKTTALEAARNANEEKATAVADEKRTKTEIKEKAVAEAEAAAERVKRQNAEAAVAAAVAAARETSQQAAKQTAEAKREAQKQQLRNASGSATAVPAAAAAAAKKSGVFAGKADAPGVDGTSDEDSFASANSDSENSMELDEIMEKSMDLDEIMNHKPTRSSNKKQKSEVPSSSTINTKGTKGSTSSNRQSARDKKRELETKHASNHNSKNISLLSAFSSKRRGRKREKKSMGSMGSSNSNNYNRSADTMSMDSFAGDSRSDHRPGTKRQNSSFDGGDPPENRGRRKVTMRNSDRLVQSSHGPPSPKKCSQSADPTGRRMAQSAHGPPPVTRQGSNRMALQRGNSTRPSPSMQRQGSARPDNRQWSSSSHEIGLPHPNAVQSAPSRSPMRKKRLDRQASGPAVGAINPHDRRQQHLRSHSMDIPQRQNSRKMAMNRTTSKHSMNGSGSILISDGMGGSKVINFYDPERASPSIRKNNGSDYEKPPRSLVFIWLVVAGELGFDLGTTVIAFKALVEEDDCCQKSIQLGPIPMTITAPFFLLVSAELAMLIRVIVMTIFPKFMVPRDDEEDEKNGVRRQSATMRWLCCCLRWKIHMIMRLLGFIILLNPFFGCLIAWILLYQSDRRDAFLVLGFEGGALLLHYVSVCLEGAITNFWEFLIHGLLPLVPFGVAVGITLFYIKQGGVCYSVEAQTFKFNGCEVCPNGYPPQDTLCFRKDGSNFTFDSINSLALENLDSLEGLTSRTVQRSYCGNDNPDGPQDVNFCFFDFEDGQLDGLATTDTLAPTPSPMFSSNRCGGTVTPGDRTTQCRQRLWNPVDDFTMHCFAAGGSGDPCHLSITNDGSNEGRFKDPQECTQEQLPDGTWKAFGDTFFLWDDPDAFEKDFVWAGNAWLAYSTGRFDEQLTELREGGVKVTTPLVNVGSPGELRTNMEEFFSACKPFCDDPESPAYVDILAVNVFCDVDVEFCRETATTATAELTALANEFGDRPVYITSWGIKESASPSMLMTAIQSTDAFFENDSPVQRVYWYGGDRVEATNLSFQSQEGSVLSLGDLWSAKCDEMNSN